MKRLASILLFAPVLAGVLCAAEPSVSVDSSYVRAITAAIAGRSAPSDQVEKTEAAINAALKDPAILAVMQEFAQSRKAFLIDRKKAPAERDASLEQRYQQALEKTVEAVKKALDQNILPKDSDGKQMESAPGHKEGSGSIVG